MIIYALVGGLVGKDFHAVPGHLLVVLSPPLLDDGVLGRVQIGSRWLCLESVHLPKEVLVELDLADVFE